MTYSLHRHILAELQLAQKHSKLASVIFVCKLADNGQTPRKLVALVTFQNTPCFGILRQKKQARDFECQDTKGAVHKLRHAARKGGGVAKYDVITGAGGALILTPKTPRMFGTWGLKNAETRSSRRSGDYCSIRGQSGSLIAHCSMVGALWPKKDLRHEICYDKGGGGGVPNHDAL